MNDPNLNEGLTPTIPNRDIFTAPPPIEQKPPENIIDKKKIVASHREFPKNAVLIFGILFLITLLILVIKVLIPKTGGTGKTVLTWWSLEEDAEAVAPLITEYESKNPNVEIKFVNQSQQDYRERLVNSIAQGKGPDIFQFHNSWTPIFSGNLTPLKEDLSSIFYPVATADLKTKNGFLGIPLEYDGIALFTNLDILQAYGKSTPKTWDDLRKTASELTVRDENGNIRQAGAALGVASNVSYWQDILALLMLQNGADLTSPSTGEGPSALTFYTNFSKIDRVWDESLPDSTTAFTNGQLAMYFGRYSDAYKIKKQSPNLHFGVTSLPQLPASGNSIPSISYASYWVNGVSKSSANPAIAWDFLKFMSSAESLRKLYANEKKLRGYGNLYPRVDMQSELLTDPIAGPFIYQASFARSWYLYANTFDGVTGINSQIAKPYSDAIDSVNGNATSDKALQDSQMALTQILSSYGIIAGPVATP